MDRGGVLKQKENAAGPETKAGGAVITGDQ